MRGGGQGGFVRRFAATGPRGRRIAPLDANLFQAPGTSPAEAQRLQAALQQPIHGTRQLKEQLMGELAGWIAQHELKQAEAATVLMVSRPRVSDVVNRKTAKFTLDALVEMLSRAGKPVRLVVGPG